MKNLTAKQEARLEKKKKKMAALAEMMKLNEKDRRRKEAGSDDNSDSTSIASLPRERKAEPSTSLSAVSRKRSQILSVSESPIETKLLKVAEPEPSISSEEYTQMKRTVHERKRASRYVPKIRLKLFGESASLQVEAAQRTPIFLTDIQHLIMGAVLGNESPCMPSRWCHIEKSSKVSYTIVLVIEGCSLQHFATYEDLFKGSSKLFENKLEIVMPRDGQTVEELMAVPLTGNQSEELIVKYGSLEAAVESTRNQMLLVRSVFPVGKDILESTSGIRSTEQEVISRKQLLLSALQLVDEGYPIPLKGELANRYKNYVLTKDRYTDVTSTSPMFGLDCEMCRTSAGINELTRISIVNEKFENVYETLVRPENKIIDYLTQYSGITGEMMLNVTKTLAEVQQDVRSLLPSDAILVGQSLQSDLVAMQMMHPYVIDTSVIFNISGERRIKSKLQTLSLEFLGEKIQDNPLGHDSIEDCSASLKLAKLKLAKGVDFGDAILSGRKRANDKKRQQHPIDGASAGDPINNNNHQQQPKTAKTTAIISSAQTNVDYEQFINAMDNLAEQKNKNIVCVKAESNKFAMRKTIEMAIQYDLTITHLKLDVERLESGNIRKTLSKLDRWIMNCWDHMAPNGLFVVILGGEYETGVDAMINSPDVSHNGVVMMDIKKNSSNVGNK